MRLVHAIACAIALALLVPVVHTVSARCVAEICRTANPPLSPFFKGRIQNTRSPIVLKLQSSQSSQFS